MLITLIKKYPNPLKNTVSLNPTKNQKKSDINQLLFLSNARKEPVVPLKTPAIKTA
jgi:hypothetical protein